jgi:hypothetical protein
VLNTPKMLYFLSRFFSLITVTPLLSLGGETHAETLGYLEATATRNAGGSPLRNGR